MHRVFPTLLLCLICLITVLSMHLSFVVFMFLVFLSTLPDDAGDARKLLFMFASQLYFYVLGPISLLGY